MRNEPLALSVVERAGIHIFTVIARPAKQAAAISVFFILSESKDLVSEEKELSNSIHPLIHASPRL
jgi:hypothetical protein